MEPKATLARRGFLRLTGLSLLAVVPGAGLVGCADPGASLRNDPRAQRAAARALELVEEGAADVLGSRYLVDVVPDADPDAVAAWLEPVIASLDTDEPTEMLATRVEDAVRDELGSDRVHDLAGWTMSPTELSICLLVHLVKP
jgi:hypothetical protein